MRGYDPSATGGPSVNPIEICLTRIDTFRALEVTFRVLQGVASIGAAITNNNDRVVDSEVVQCRGLPPAILLAWHSAR